MEILDSTSLERMLTKLMTSLVSLETSSRQLSSFLIRYFEITQELPWNCACSLFDFLFSFGSIRLSMSSLMELILPISFSIEWALLIITDLASSNKSQVLLCSCSSFMAILQILQPSCWLFLLNSVNTDLQLIYIDF